jgi:phosphatidylglycerophosphate synthase
LAGTSWTHLLARAAIRPLLGTSVRPNHLTTLRLVTGLAACAAFATGTHAGMVWGGVIWLVSAFLDRADGELARIGNMMSRGGHLYDYYTDNLINALFFVSVGVGLPDDWALPLGLLGGFSLLVCGWWSELLERASPPDTRAYSGRWGFDPDDALYLMSPFAWIGILDWILIGAAIAAPIVTAITGIRLLRLTTGRARAEATGK